MKKMESPLHQPSANETQKRLDELAAECAALKSINAKLTEQVKESSLMALIASRTDNAVVLTDRQGRIEWVNESFCRMTGYSSAEIKGLTPGSFLHTPQTNPETIAYMRERLNQAQAFDAELLNQNKAGTPYWVHIEVQPIRDESGNVIRFMAVERDVTQRRRSEARLSLHHAVIQLLSDASDIRQMFPQLLELLCTYLDCTVALAWEVKSKRWVGDVDIRCADVWTSNPLRYAGFLETAQKMTCLKGQGLPGLIWQTRQPQYVPRLKAIGDDSRASVADKEGLHTALALPVLAGDRVTHVLEFTGAHMEAPDDELLRVLDGVCVQVAHFVDRMRDEARVRQFMTEFDSLFKLSPDGFVVFNAEGIRSYGNPAFYTMTGLPRERLDGVTEAGFDDILASLCAPEHRPQPMGEVARQGAGDQLQLVQPRRAILQRSVRDMYDPMGRYIGRAVYLRDITHQTEVDRMKSEFLSTAAHELRTPMASVHGFTELLLKRTFSDEKRKDIYETIHRQSTLLVNMVTELLDLARIESRSGKDFDIQPTKVPDIVDRVIHGLLILGDKRKVDVSMPADLPEVFADEDHLSRALTNLLSNAYKYSPQGGTIALDVLLRQTPSGQQVGICVKDQGIGMTPSQLERVFERFYRADPSGNIPGTGLGMSLVKEIMTLMGGEVELTSEFGKGTSAILWLRVVTDVFREKLADAKGQSHT